MVTMVTHDHLQLPWLYCVPTSGLRAGRMTVSWRTLLAPSSPTAGWEGCQGRGSKTLSE